MIAPFPSAFFSSASAGAHGSAEEPCASVSATDEGAGGRETTGAPARRPDSDARPVGSVAVIGVPARTFYDALWSLIAPSLARALAEWERGR